MEARANAERHLKEAKEKIEALKKENETLQGALKGEVSQTTLGNSSFLNELSLFIFSLYLGRWVVGLGAERSC